MTAWRLILADDDSNGLMKALPVLVFVAIWVVGIITKLAKRNGQTAERATPPAAGAIPASKPISVSSPARRVAGAAPRLAALQKAPKINRPVGVKLARPVPRPGALSASRTKAAFAQQQADLIRGMLAGRPAPGKQRREPVVPKREPVLTEITPAPQDPLPVARAQELPKVDARGLSKRMQPSL